MGIDGDITWGPGTSSGPMVIPPWKIPRKKTERKHPFLGRKANMNIAASWAQQFLMMMRSDSTNLWLWPFELCPPKLKMLQRLSASWTVVNFLVLMAEFPWREDEVHTRFTLTMQPPDITTIRNDLLNGSMFGGWRIWLWVKPLGPYLS